MNKRRIAAIFDVDGTLIADATLERIFIRFLRRRGELGWREMINWIGASIRAAARWKAAARGTPAIESDKSLLAR